jgi:hypothetical protein
VRRFTGRAARFALLGTLSVAGGCAAPVIVATAGLTAVEAGTSAYIRGVLEAAERASLDEMWVAATRMFENLQYKVVQANRYDNYCYMAARAENGSSITVRLERSSPMVTNINIRVGLLGDQSLSQLLLATMREELSKIRSAPKQEETPKSPEPDG